MRGYYQQVEQRRVARQRARRRYEVYRRVPARPKKRYRKRKVY